MHLTAKIDGHGVSLTATDSGYMDAAVVNTLAGLELEIQGELRVAERDDKRSNILSMTLTPARMRALGLLLLAKSGAPALTEPQWRQVIDALRTSSAEVNQTLARQIQTQLECDGAA